MAETGVSWPNNIKQELELKDSNHDYNSTGKQIDLRRTKAELFNKLIGNNPQQMIVTQNLDKTKETQQNNDNINDRNKSNDEHQLNSAAQGDQVIFTRIRGRWYTNEEVASILTNFSSHPEWQTNELQMRPKSGAVLLYSREKVRYRQDGYCWKKRKNGRTTREDHMKLKVQGIECIYGCYVHSALLPTFHRRCYWLLQNPDIVLVHYLNQPLDDQNKMVLSFNCSLLELDTRRSWTNEEIIEEIGSVFGGISEIHHTLSLNFPPTGGAAQLEGSVICQVDDRISEMSPDQSDNQLIDSNRTSSGEQIESNNLHNTTNQAVVDEDEIMATGQDSNSSMNQELIAGTDGTARDIGQQISSNNVDSNGMAETQIRADDAVSMNFDVDCRVDTRPGSGLNNDNDTGPTGASPVCYDFNASPNNATMNLDETVAILATTNTADHIDQPDGVKNTMDNVAGDGGGQMDESPCSPVTQIYNKIVDDIESYALPLEPNQFHSSHHHHHHHHHNLHGHSMPDQSMDLGGIGENLNCVNSMMSQNQINPMDHFGHQQQGQSSHQRLQKRHSTAGQHYSDQHNNDNHQSECRVDFTSCDLFGTCGLSDMNSGGADDLLLNGFNLATTSSGVSNQHADDMLIGNSMDLFNFKPSSAFEQKQQLDVKSTTSETDTLNRLSPMAPLVPRCNSTDNAMQPAGQRLDQYQHHLSSHYLATIAHQQQQDSMGEPDNKSIFSEYDHQHHPNPTNLETHRSVTTSTNPSNSTSCSPSPSSSSLLTTEHPSSARSGYIDNNSSTHCLTGSSSHSFIKLPLQQRQKSEQREPSNSVLNSLLPKALSLDGSDLSATSHAHRLHHQLHQPNNHHHLGMQLPHAVGPHATMRQQHLLLPPSTGASNMACSNQQQQQACAPSTRNQAYYQRPSMASISPSSAFTASMMSHNQQANQFSASSVVGRTVGQQQQHQASELRLLPIIDFVPSCAPASGGTKVVLIGDWTSLLSSNRNQQQQQQQQNSLAAGDSPATTSMSPSSSSSASNGNNGFHVMFDELIVPAILIQDNVIRCYAPAYEPGLRPLRVLYMNRIVSEQVLFEFKSVCCVNSNTSGDHHQPVSSGQPTGYTDISSGCNNNGNNIKTSNTPKISQHQEKHTDLVESINNI